MSSLALGLLVSGCPADTDDVVVGDDDDASDDDDAAVDDDDGSDDDDSAADDDDGADDDDACPDEYEAEACAEVFCNLPTVEVGTGTDGFAPLAEGQAVPIVYGAQGGYHVDMTVRMTELCQIVFLQATMYLDPGDGGDLIEVFGQTRHIQAQRQDPDSSVQDFWGIRAFVPCEYFPDDPDHSIECDPGSGSAGHLEDFEIVLKMEAWDHNVGAGGEEQVRYGSDERRVQPYCCE